MLLLALTDCTMERLTETIRHYSAPESNNVTCQKRWKQSESSQKCIFYALIPCCLTIHNCQRLKELEMDLLIGIVNDETNRVKREREKISVVWNHKNYSFIKWICNLKKCSLKI